MDYYIIHEIFSFSDEVNKRATASKFKDKLDNNMNALLEASHHKKNLASLKYFNYLRAKEKTTTRARYLSSAQGTSRARSFYCIIEPKKVKPHKETIQCYAKTCKGTRCKLKITGDGCVLFCSKHKTCKQLYWV